MAERRSVAAVEWSKRVVLEALRQATVDGGPGLRFDEVQALPTLYGREHYARVTLQTLRRSGHVDYDSKRRRWIHISGKLGA